MYPAASLPHQDSHISWHYPSPDVVEDIDTLDRALTKEQREGLVTDLIDRTMPKIESWLEEDDLSLVPDSIRLLSTAHIPYFPDAQDPDAQFERPHNGPATVATFMRSLDDIGGTFAPRPPGCRAKWTVTDLPQSIIMEAATVISHRLLETTEPVASISRLHYEDLALDCFTQQSFLGPHFLKTKLAEIDAFDEHRSQTPETECRNRIFQLLDDFSTARKNHLTVGSRANTMEMVPYYDDMWRGYKGTSGYDYLIAHEPRLDRVPGLREAITAGDNEEARAARLSDGLGLLINYVEESERAHETYSRMGKTGESFEEASMSERTRRLRDLAKVVEKNRSPTETLGDPFE